jgi:hypothetical protein
VAETSEQKLLGGSPIDPATVKIEDIKRYEALMKGRAVSAVSNASSMRGLVESEIRGSKFYRRHHWKVKGQSEFGPMDI